MFNLLLFATSIVKLIAGCASFNVAKKVVAVEMRHTQQSASRWKLQTTTNYLSSEWSSQRLGNGWKHVFTGKRQIKAFSFTIKVMLTPVTNDHFL